MSVRNSNFDQTYLILQVGPDEDEHDKDWEFEKALKDFEKRELPKLLIESYTQEDFEYETTLRALED